MNNRITELEQKVKNLEAIVQEIYEVLATHQDLLTAQREINKLSTKKHEVEKGVWI